jgi:hypothetical protein
MKLYRYIKAVQDEDATDIRLICEEHIVCRETEKSYFINIYGKEKRTSKTSKSRFAYLTKEEALTNYIARTKRSIIILKIQLKCSEIALEKAIELQNK